MRSFPMTSKCSRKLPKTGSRSSQHTRARSSKHVLEHHLQQVLETTFPTHLGAPPETLRVGSLPPTHLHVVVLQHTSCSRTHQHMVAKLSTSLREIPNKGSKSSFPIVQSPSKLWKGCNSSGRKVAILWCKILENFARFRLHRHRSL